MIKAELDKSGRRILVDIPYDPDDFNRIKEIKGWSWRKKDRVWSVPLELEAGRALRKMFGDRLAVGPRMLAWGRLEATKKRNLSKISTADDFPLEEMRTSQVNPELGSSLWPHQRADSVFMARTSCINGNEQGTGKTREVLVAAIEGQRDDGFHLVLAGVKSIEATWSAELEQWTGHPVLASEDLRVREQHVEQAYKWTEEGQPFWLVVNAEMVRLTAEYERVWKEHKGKYVREEISVEERYPELFNIDWSSMTIDEFHKLGLSNLKTLTHRAVKEMKCERVYFMSGTPMGGKPSNLFGPLRLLDPKHFRSKTRWEDQHLEISEDQVTRYRKVRKVGGVKRGHEDAFYQHLAPYMVRRLKAEVFPDLPPKEYEDVWCYMTKNQAEQYREFEARAELLIDEHHLSANNALAEYARLRFFATAYCEVEGKLVRCKQCLGTGDLRGQECPWCIGVGFIDKLRLKPTEDCGKLPYLMTKLDECGVHPDQVQYKALVGSQHRDTAYMLRNYLGAQGYAVGTIIAGEKVSIRDLVRDFQKPDHGPQIIVMTYGSGGVSLTLDRADSVHLIDETYIPDETEQVEDRAHRGSRMHRVRCFYYRAHETIEVDIKNLNDDKGYQNWDVLDLRRLIAKRKDGDGT